MWVTIDAVCISNQCTKSLSFYCCIPDKVFSNFESFQFLIPVLKLEYFKDSSNCIKDK